MQSLINYLDHLFFPSQVCAKAILFSQFSRVFKHAERIKASRLILVGESEWRRGMVRVKNLANRVEEDVKIDELE